MSDKPAAPAKVRLSADELASKAEKGNFKEVNDALAEYRNAQPEQFRSLISGVKAANLQHVEDEQKTVRDFNSKLFRFSTAEAKLPTLIFTDSDGDKIPDKISGFILKDGTSVAQPEKPAATASEPKQAEKEGRTFSFGPRAAEDAWNSFYPKK
ncbi:MAG: hypothetical protein IAF58_04555 [Leptolyngbya sp.]|nr:hypothetical protein [Candidatus Melainabacteria bacterium]